MLFQSQANYVQLSQDGLAGHDILFMIIYLLTLCYLVDLLEDCLKFEDVFEATGGLLDCQQLLCSVNPSTDREKPLAGIFENSLPPLLYLKRQMRL